MKASFILALVAVLAVTNAAPCGKNHPHTTTQVQTVNSDNNGRNQAGGLIGISALNGPINVLGTQTQTSSTTMNQSAN
ncbi:hypothetical protein BX666DRAFT_2023408 [Dichotomocladium elegans]|nr:hypothetical protein BX666DRAFT_2023408 [Dichotomocladium elegans]